jgi:hypothetical protein
MNGPKRSHDELADLGQALLSAGRKEQPDARALKRTLSLLAAASAGTAGALSADDALAAGEVLATKSSATSAGAALTPTALSGTGAGVAVPKAALAVTLAKWLGTGALFGGLVVGGSQAWQTLSKSPGAPPSERTAQLAMSHGAAESRRDVASAPVTNEAPGAARVEPAATVSDVPLAPQLEPSTAQSSAAQSSAAQSSAAQDNAKTARPDAEVAQRRASRQPVADARLSSPQEPSRQEPSLGDSVTTEDSEAHRAGSVPPSSAPFPAVPAGAAKAVAPAQDNARALPPPSAKDRLAEEVRFIEQARAQLAQGNTSETLRVLDEYSARFPRAALGPEALYLRMEALWRSGNREAALAVARRIVESSTNGPAARRAQELLQ